MYYAQLNEADTVIGVTQPCGEIESTNMISLNAYDISIIGYRYNRETKVFEPVTVPTSTPRHITVGAFYDRFGAAKWEILSSTDTMVQALIKDASVRAYIDLDRPDLLDALYYIQRRGFTIDPQQIISDPVLEHELR